MILGLIWHGLILMVAVIQMMLKVHFLQMSDGALNVNESVLNFRKGDDPFPLVSRLNDVTLPFLERAPLRVVGCRLQMLMIWDVTLSSSGTCDSDFNVNDLGGGMNFLF